MKVDSWEQLMEVIDINGDGKVTIEEMERQVVAIDICLKLIFNMNHCLFSFQVFPFQSIKLLLLYPFTCKDLTLSRGLQPRYLNS
jgi:hypothetical protein